MQKPKLLFIGSGPQMPKKTHAYSDRYQWLSKWCEGYIITPVIGDMHMSVDRIGAFRFLPYKYHSGSIIIRNVKLLLHTIGKALALHLSGNRFDVVISHNPLITGILAVFIARITGTKALIEVNGNFEAAFKFGPDGRPDPGVSGKIKQHIACPIASYVISKADMTKYMYEGQLSFVNKRVRSSLNLVKFPNFVPVSRFLENKPRDDKYVLFMGFPWYLKGVDVLLRAFNKISHKFPQHSLKIVGWCPTGREYFEKLANNNPHIELLNSVFYDKVPEIMSKCSLFVLPSRTEGIARVLSEAMASQKPIVASRIDGTPTIIKNGYNGLLFESEDVDQLAEKMSMVLSNRALAKRLGRNGNLYVRKYIAEEHYTFNYRKSIERLIGSAQYEQIGVWS